MAKGTVSEEEERQGSHEDDYRTPFFQGRGAPKKEPLEAPGRNRGVGRPRHHTEEAADYGRITETVLIRGSSGEGGDRGGPGPREGELLFFRASRAIATLVERQTRYLMLVRVADKDSETVINALIKQGHRWPGGRKINGPGTGPRGGGKKGLFRGGRRGGLIFGFPKGLGRGNGMKKTKEQ